MKLDILKCAYCGKKFTGKKFTWNEYKAGQKYCCLSCRQKAVVARLEAKKQKLILTT